MKKTNSLFFLMFIPGLFLLYSCGEDDSDNIPPDLSIQSSQPPAIATEVCDHLEENVFQIYSGDTLQLALRIEDNELLSQLKVDVHNNFDCHGHGGGQVPAFDPPDVTNQTEDWTILDIADLEGNSEELQLFLAVPNNVTRGIYHLGMQVVDAAGNESSSLIYDMDVRNKADTIVPEIHMDSPGVMQLQVSKGEQIEFRGRVIDNRALDIGGNAIIYLTYENESTEEHFTGPYEVFQSGAGTEETFKLGFAFPQSVEAGVYNLYVNAHDGVRNIATPIAYDIQVSN